MIKNIKSLVSSLIACIVIVSCSGGGISKEIREAAGEDIKSLKVKMVKIDTGYFRYIPAYNAAVEDFDGLHSSISSFYEKANDALDLAETWSRLSDELYKIYDEKAQALKAEGDSLRPILEARGAEIEKMKKDFSSGQLYVARYKNANTTGKYSKFNVYKVFARQPDGTLAESEGNTQQLIVSAFPESKKQLEEFMKELGSSLGSIFDE